MTAAVPEARPFSRRENGTDEPTWLLDTRWNEVPRLDLDAVIRRCPKVLLVAPHPHDETLALGATVAHLAAADVDVTVVVATHGGDGNRPTVRRSEGENAIAALDASISIVWWDLPDGRLSTHEAELEERLTALVDAQTLILAPVECDGHADHEAVARAAESAAREVGATLLQYPYWLWQWASPSDLDWTRLRNLAPPLGALQAKSQAVEHYRSQLRSGDDAPIVGPAVLARSRRVIETVLVPASADLAARVDADTIGERSASEISAPFDTMYDDDEDDPWRLDDSFYEMHRLDLVTACLGHKRYRRALDIGCATGQLAERLKSRADAVTGLDTSSAALDIARVRTPEIRWMCGAVPADLPDEKFDLIVLSEVAYFLDGPDLLSTLRAVRGALLPEGEIVLANWRHPTENIPLDGPTAHRQAAAMMGLPRRACYEDADLLIEVWGDPVSLHVESRRRS